MPAKIDFVVRDRGLLQSAWSSFFEIFLSHLLEGQHFARCGFLLTGISSELNFGQLLTGEVSCLLARHRPKFPDDKPLLGYTAPARSRAVFNDK